MYLSPPRRRRHRILVAVRSKPKLIDMNTPRVHIIFEAALCVHTRHKHVTYKMLVEGDVDAKSVVQVIIRHGMGDTQRMCSLLRL